MQTHQVACANRDMSRAVFLSMPAPLDTSKQAVCPPNIISTASPFRSVLALTTIMIVSAHSYFCTDPPQRSVMIRKSHPVQQGGKMSRQDMATMALSMPYKQFHACYSPKSRAYGNNSARTARRTTPMAKYQPMLIDQLFYDHRCLIVRPAGCKIWLTEATIPMIKRRRYSTTTILS